MAMISRLFERKCNGRKKSNYLSLIHRPPNNGLEASVNKSEAPQLSVNGGRNRNEDHIYVDRGRRFRIWKQHLKPRKQFNQKAPKEKRADRRRNRRRSWGKWGFELSSDRECELSLCLLVRHARDDENEERIGRSELKRLILENSLELVVWMVIARVGGGSHELLLAMVDRVGCKKWWLELIVHVVTAVGWPKLFIGGGRCGGHEEEG
ncbi:unnamed protein product [Citrullus colocynthis]|uniref:Uncharacterized protein n=1 Tax=Citrullus colocynthis TaxID=252529 RepID=A0ABP0Z155_9ROSI